MHRDKAKFKIFKNRIIKKDKYGGSQRVIIKNEGETIIK